jgi:carbamoyl-phosphate synthase large subunit/carbamoyl-phosphate synthase small subunit
MQALVATGRLAVRVNSNSRRQLLQRSLSSDTSLTRGKLVLEDGTEFDGKAFGSLESKSGEIVFSTNMVGYPESMTDPSFAGQIINFTYPLIGNYGVPSRSATDEHGLLKYMESNRIWCNGIIVSNYSEQYSHWNAECSLDHWMKEQGIPGLHGIDTRALTMAIREKGAMKAKILTGEQAISDPDSIRLVDINSRNLVEMVSRMDVRTYNPKGLVKVIAVDCGIKTNIIRCLVEAGACVQVVPATYDFHKLDYDGIFLSNGPGDPSMATDTIENVRRALDGHKPIFGICLGNQLLARAAGAETYKLPYGNRGQNQPCIEQIVKRAYITSQNHGYAVKESTLPPEWTSYFRNANDNSNEGIMHRTKPFFSVQFHPEARGGPDDTRFLFDQFIDLCMRHKRTPTAPPAPLKSFSLPIPPVPRWSPNKVLVLGSGGLSIGQAGEFDYSGSQAIKAYKEIKCKTVLINSNIASIQTAEGLADSVYYLPTTPEIVERVIERERPDAIALSFGGQTALNCGVALAQSGVLERYGVQVLGTSVDTIIKTEDRQLFNDMMNEIDQPVANSEAVSTVADALTAAERVEYPVMMRAAFALGGLGSGFAKNAEELAYLAQKALAVCPQVLVEKDLRGWKEVEYEVVRDAHDNCITVCNMENFDPMGLHTGESIVVAPSQTLTNDEYHLLRTAAIDVVRHLGIVGECNIQYTLDPNSQRYSIIEVNPRLSRSSALASKATGYPLAFVAAKLGLGVALPEIENAVTRCTQACFEPALDYCVVKVPRWDLNKFEGVNRHLGSAMKSVGEVMGIGRTFEEGLQKALRMVDESNAGFEPTKFAADVNAITEELSTPTDLRIHAIARALYSGIMDVDQIHEITKIDKWYLHKLQNLVNISNEVQSYNSTAHLAENRDLVVAAKVYGFTDEQIAARISDRSRDAQGFRSQETVDADIREMRKSLGIVPSIKQIDTLAAEFPASTSYLYMTYSGQTNDVQTFDKKDKTVLIIGSGVYRIGSSVEFDYCSVEAVRTLRRQGYKTIMLNYNPETVSTDYDESDKLFFEEISLERVMDIYDAEQPEGVIISVGGQAPNNMAMRLQAAGANILGTTADSIDNCEDRDRYSSMLDALEIQQPDWCVYQTPQQVREFCDKVGYPVLIRPSYVLSGAAMNVANNQEELTDFIGMALEASGERTSSNLLEISAGLNRIVVTKFLEDAIEVDVDGVAQGGEMRALAISEHLERGGVHSGDATLIMPSQNLTQPQIDRIKNDTAKIASQLNISGPFNTQFLCKDDWIGVIETNLRASRSVPFVSKCLGRNFIDIATRSVMGLEEVDYVDSTKQDLSHVLVKSPQFSFQRLPGADPLLGVEMSSTGEVACFGYNTEEAYLKSIIASGFRMPDRNKDVLLIATPEHVAKQMDSIRALHELKTGGFKFSSMDLEVSAVMEENGIPCDYYDPEDKALRNELAAKRIGMMLDLARQNEHAHIRGAAIDFAVPLFTDMQQIKMLGRALELDVNDLGINRYADYDFNR